MAPLEEVNKDGGIYMGTMPHVLLLLALCVAVGIMIYRFAQKKAKNVLLERLALLTLGIGFLAGGLYQVISAPTNWIFILYILGVYLCYTAMLFSFPGKEAARPE